MDSNILEEHTASIIRVEPEVGTVCSFVTLVPFFQITTLITQKTTI
jgi:hypothetical protein